MAAPVQHVPRVAAHEEAAHLRGSEQSVGRWWVVGEAIPTMGLLAHRGEARYSPWPYWLYLLWPLLAMALLAMALLAIAHLLWPYSRGRTSLGLKPRQSVRRGSSSLRFSSRAASASYPPARSGTWPDGRRRTLPPTAWP